MKTIIVLLFVFVTQNCNQKEVANLSQQKLPAEIEDVYFQKWIGGQQESGSGINFYIQFKNPLPKDITLKKVYFQNQEATFEAEDTTHFIARFQQKTKSDLTLDSDTKKEYGNKPPEIKNKNLNLKADKAILEFVQSKKTVTYKIEKIKEKEVLAYPTQKPANE